MGTSLRMLERDLKVAQKTDCISALRTHSRGGVPTALQRIELPLTFQLMSASVSKVGAVDSCS